MKEYLSQKGVTFTERDLTKDENAMVELQKMRIMTTPVTTIDREIVIGFDQKKFEQLLGS